MQVRATSIPGLLVLTPRVFTDQRGFFMETYSRRVLAEHGVACDFVQDNHARSEARGVLRGLHFQTPPSAQAKLVRVSRGAVYDVAVDLRVGSPAYGTWHAETLTADNHVQMFIPAGCVHGYLTLAPGTEFQYKVDAYYDPARDTGILWNDPDLGIPWPEAAPLLSDRDRALPRLADYASPFVFAAGAGPGAATPNPEEGR
ncbi:dTDP-4-dehydrorhamnose 3,5-epimerase [Desulfocurvus vexinensis]|uniref:dTDP-4-dehydrorhamnose 3,5-epimerase n=1 Tax=Desulfocurvus vexinensis TaxID=399548 RepID=UPI0004ADB868|nr:dTDP-4-dehydrorhamnose 3,5-epimerase [Desulfocurvus vexinensis]